MVDPIVAANGEMASAADAAAGGSLPSFLNRILGIPEFLPTGQAAEPSATTVGAEAARWRRRQRHRAHRHRLGRQRQCRPQHCRPTTCVYSEP